MPRSAIIRSLSAVLYPILAAILLASPELASAQTPIIVTGVTASIGTSHVDFERGWLAFAVKNTTAQSQSVHVQGDCGAAHQYEDWYYDSDFDSYVDGGCSAINSTVTIAAGQTLTISSGIGFDPMSMYDDRVTLTVYPVGSPGAAFAGVARVTYNGSMLAAQFLTSGMYTYTPRVSPKTGSATVATSGTSSQAITVSNVGNATAIYSLTASCSGFVTGCGIGNTTTSTGTLTVAAGASAATSLNYGTGTTGSTGIARLVVTAPMSSAGFVQADTATITVTPSVPASSLAPVIAVAPTNGTVFSTATTGQVRVDYCDGDDPIVQRTVTWQGQTLPDNFTGLSKSGCLMAGYSIFNNLTLVPWQQNLVVTARDYAGHVSTSTTSFTYSAPLAGFRPAVTASSDWHRLSSQGSVAAADTFTVQNLGAYGVAYVVNALCGSATTLSNCVANKGSVSLAAGASTAVVVNYTRSGALDRADTVRLAATFTSPLGGVIADTGKKVVIALSVEAAPVVTGTTGTVQIPVSVVFWESFTLTNPNTAPATYTLTVTTTNGFLINGSSGTTPPWTVTVPPGQTASVPVGVGTPGSTGVSGTITLAASYLTTAGATLNASAMNSMVTGSSGTPTGSSIVVTPISAGVVPQGVQTPQRFTVKNNGAKSDTVTYAAVCSDGFACALPDHSTKALVVGQVDTVRVDVTAGAVAGLAGTVTLTASKGSLAFTGSASISTALAAGPVTLSVAAQMNAGAAISRDQCLTIATGDEAAYECGDLRVVHPLPTTTTFNRARTPTLIYTSAHAHPVVLIQADVGIDGTMLHGACPLVVATVHLSSTDSVTKLFTWTGVCTQKATRRIVVPVDAQAHSLGTGLYKYTLEVRVAANNTWWSVPDTAETFVVINRAQFPRNRFGTGWWLDGLEELIAVPGHNDQFLWIGGDGSTRVYTQRPGTNTFLVQPTLDRPDTLTKIGSNEYRRLLRNGAYVQFDGLLRHVATVNSFGQATRFVWNSNTSSQLDSVVLAVPTPNDPAARRAYGFGYSNGVLTSVTAPTGPNGPRVTTLSRNNVSGGTDLAIADPGAPIAVHYLADALGRITSRTNRLTDGTRFEYDPVASVITRVSIDLSRTSGAVDSIRTTYCAAEAAGITSVPTCASGLVDPLTVRTRLDGPRIDVQDTTAFYVNRFGAPTATVNALGYATRIERTDLRFPLLATAVVQANGHRVEARYTSRGLTDKQIDISPLGNEGVAQTQYAWNATFDKVDAITAPTGETSHFGYFPNGDRQWQEDGRGPMSRTWFTYNADHQVETIQPPGNTTSELQRFEYEATLGNLLRSITPKGATTFSHTDLLGRVDSVATPSNDTQEEAQRFVFDIRDRVLTETHVGQAVPYSVQNSFEAKMAPAVKLVVTNGYDDEGHLLSLDRRSEPNLANTTNPSTLWTYDAAGRKLTETHIGSRNQSWSYDPAGNVKDWTTGRPGMIVSTTYDELNRPRHRTIPQVLEPAQWGTQRFQCMPHAARFPYFSYADFDPIYNPAVEGQCDFGTTALPPWLLIPSDAADFAYDDVGNLKTANNNDARISRDYYPNGALKTETQAIAIFDASTPLNDRFNSHRYQLDYSYDLSGRRISRTDDIPTCSGCVQRYQYNSLSGFLESTTDAGAGHNAATFNFAYDAAGRLFTNSVSTGASATEQHYDADGRLSSRTVTGAGGLIYQDDIGYDRAGHVTSTSISTSIANVGGSTTATYNGLGALAVFSQVRNSLPIDDEYVTDGLGSRISDKRWTEGHATSHEYRYTRELLDQVGQTTAWQSGDPPPPSAFQKGDTTTTNYGPTAAVNYVFHGGFVFNTSANQWAPDPLSEQWSWHAYGGDEKLRASQRSSQTEQGPRTVFSDYRYDALGRRVAVRTRWDPYCQGSAPTCLATIERTIWDGDQVLMELRSQAANELEYGLGQFLGTVRYTHAAGIDEPLALWKLDIGGIIPHRSWRGTYEAGTSVDGTSSGVTWPARMMDAFHAPDTRLAKIEPSAWIGSIVEGKTDPTGLQYMRNRYYDPASGRFTQEDPIGLAGGMNLYGFTGGDPVNFEDPFGLCPVVGLLAGPVIGGATAVWCGAELAVLGTAAFMASRRFPKSVKDETETRVRGANGGVERCSTCGAELTPDAGHDNSREFDHLTSVKKGGGSGPENCDEKCRKHNRQKGSLNEDEWQKKVKDNPELKKPTTPPTP